MPSPSSAFELSYDFPVAGPSSLAPPRSPRRTRPSPARSPVRPRWELDNDNDEPETDEIDYDAFGYPRRAQTYPQSPTRNQWRAPSPTHLSAYPYASAYPSYSSAPAYTTAPYATSTYSPYAAAALPLPSSCESERSALSAAAHAIAHAPHKIRKPRPSPTHSRCASPASSRSSHSAFDDDESDVEDLEDEQEEDAEERGRTDERKPCPSPQMSLRRQWAALSLRVRFGVFRAKRRMRNRVMSL